MDIQKIITKLKEHWQIAAGVLAALVAIAGFLVFSSLSKPSENNQMAEMTAQPSGSELDESSSAKSRPSGTHAKKDAGSKSTESPDKIVVDIKGAVRKPSIYTVDASLRVNDVIQLAGGFSENANQKTINLAAKISDAQVIYVPSIGENTAAAAVDTTTAGPAPSDGNTTAPAESAKVNINAADLTKLQTLSGVGQKKAQDIIDYRTQNGPFKTVDDLGNVSGFGPKSLEKLKESITVD
jgi:competence protein ComEA